MPTLTTYSTPILEEWVDYNGHLRDAFYLLIFSYATDALMDRLGLDSQSREAGGHSLFTLEAHLNYLHEVKLGARVEVRTQLIGTIKNACTFITACTWPVMSKPWPAMSKCCCMSTWQALALHRSTDIRGCCCKRLSASNAICLHLHMWAARSPCLKTTCS